MWSLHAKVLYKRKKRVCHKPHPTRPERAEAPSPGQHPGYDDNQQDALKGQKLYVLSGVFKAFALTGRQVCVRNYPGRCPGLGASALSIIFALGKIKR